MILTIKNIQQKTFSIEIDENETVVKLKERILLENGEEYPVENQKLIYAGLILDDSKTLASYKIDEKKFIVLMVTKAAKAKESSEKTEVLKENNNQKPVASGGHEEMVNNIMALGYQRDVVERALCASQNNPDGAVEFLLNEIPTRIAAQNNQTNNPTTSQPLEFLRSTEQFQQMRQVIQRNPEVLQTVFQQIQETNPNLLQLISENQNEFINMLNEREPGGEEENAQGIIINEHDRIVIDRLKSLGFPEQLVLQAYFACDKNEELTVNFLIENVEMD